MDNLGLCPNCGDVETPGGALCARCLAERRDHYDGTSIFPTPLPTIADSTHSFMDITRKDAERADAQPERRCDGCALWVPKYAAMGECMLPWAIDTAVRLQGEGCNELPTLMTPGYHSCAGFEARKEGDNE